MISFDISSRSPESVECELLVLFVLEGLPQEPVMAAVTRALDVDAPALLRRHGFSGKEGDAFVLETFGRLPARTVLFVGLGLEAGAAMARQSAMRAAKLAIGYESAAAALATPGPASSPGAFAEGLLLGVHRFDRYKTDPAGLGSPGARRLERVTLLVPSRDRARARAEVRRAEVYAGVTNWARDLVDMPAADATPAALADEAKRMAREFGLECKVWSKPELARGGFGGVLGVGQGSANEPRLVDLRYRNAGNARPIALTGKGITFDSGGLSLKRPSEMEWMKSDMAGAASAMAAIRGAGELGLRANLVASLPFAENLPGGSALRPGDIVRHRGGRTSEVMDTDSEGRLVLADALAYLAEGRPAAILDAATLTDAGGLGASLWAALGNDRALAAEVLAAGEDAGDPGWELPLPPAYRKLLESPVADLRNTPSEGDDTTVMAAMYLREFVGDVPWVHIDNGSTAYLEREVGPWPKGATGSPARAMLRFIENRSARRRAARV